MQTKLMSALPTTFDVTPIEIPINALDFSRGSQRRRGRSSHRGLKFRTTATRCGLILLEFTLSSEHLSK